MRRLLAVMVIFLAACGDGDPGTDPPNPCDPACAINVEGVFRHDADSADYIRFYNDNPDSTAVEGFVYANDLHTDDNRISYYWGTYTAREDSVFLTFNSAEEAVLSDGLWNSDGSFDALHRDFGVVTLQPAG